MKLLIVRENNNRTCDSVVQYQLITDEAFDTCKNRIEALKNTGATVTYYDDDDREIDQLTVEDAEEILNTAVDVSDDEIATLMKLVSHVIKDFQLEGIIDMLEDSLDG